MVGLESWAVRRESETITIVFEEYQKTEVPTNQIEEPPQC